MIANEPACSGRDFSCVKNPDAEKNDAALVKMGSGRQFFGCKHTFRYCTIVVRCEAIICTAIALTVS